MGQSSRKEGEQSAIAPRNFSLTSEERVRAIAAGPPAHMRRLRAIEDLEEGIVRVLAQRYAEARAQKIEPRRLRSNRKPRSAPSSASPI